MSSSDEQETTSNPLSKTSNDIRKRKIHRACDFCRRRKARCDGYEMPGNRCTNCVGASNECTYLEVTKKRSDMAYVAALETRLANMEHLFKLISPYVDMSKIPSEYRPDSLETENTNQNQNLLNSTTLSAFSTSPTQSDSTPFTEGDSSASEDEYITIAITSTNPQVNNPSYNARFFGKSSGLLLARNAKEMKKWVGRGLEEKSSPVVFINNPRRLENWITPSWVYRTLRPADPDYHLPEPDLLSSLVELYFTNVNIFFPLLHRPIFERSLLDGLHKRDDGFAASVVLICAIGCRFSEDPRIIHRASSESERPTSWKLFNQVRRLRHPGLFPQSIYDLHVFALAALFLHVSAPPEAACKLVGSGLRFIQEVGAHRRALYGSKPSINNESWKRAFWVLLVIDRLTSCCLGRPCALQDEEFDIDLPTECDDEYWAHPDPEQAFKQPMGKPSQVTFFVWFIKLNQILAFALRSIYSMKKSKIILGFAGTKRSQHIVAELDSAVNKWADSVPDCLRWDPGREDLTTLRQSAILYSFYYDLQIIIHRPYSLRTSSALSYTSMTICANAARSCCHMLDGSRNRLGYVLNQCVRPIFSSGVMLLLSLWSGKSMGRTVDYAKEMEDFRKCQSLLQQCESRWVHAGRLVDALTAIRNGEMYPRGYPFDNTGTDPVPPPGWMDPVTTADLVDTSETTFGTVDHEGDSEGLTQLPFQFEQFLDIGNPLSPPSQNWDKSTLNPTLPQGSSFPPLSEPQSNYGDSNSIIPFGLLMYNDLIGSRQIMDWTSTACLSCGNNTTQCGCFSVPAEKQSAVSASGGAPDDMWSAGRPSGYDDWENWTSYANLLNQIQTTPIDTQASYL